MYLDCYNENSPKISMICLQETWLAADSELSLLQIEGYNLISCGKSCSAHGGVAIYLHEQFKYKSIIIENSDIWDGQFLEIFIENINKETKRVLVGNVYRPPRPLVENIQTFTNEIESLLHHFRNYKHVIITGDFNLDLLKFQMNNNINNFLDTFISNGYIPKITLPTRLNSRNGTLIDNFFIKIADNFSSTSAGVLTNQISDHLPYFVILDYLDYAANKNKYMRISSSKKNASLNLKTDLQMPETINKLNNIIGPNINTSYKNFRSILNPLINKHFPVKFVRFNKYKHKKTEWVTEGILKSIHFRDKLYSKLKATPIDDLNYNIKKTNLTTYNKILKQCIRQAKTSYYYKRFQNCKNDIKKTWQTINELINRKKTKPDLPKSFKIDESIEYNETTIANKFNEYFIEIGPTLAENIHAPADKSFTNYLKNQPSSEFKFKLINKECVIKTIDNLKPKTSCGTDQISNKTLKNIKHEISYSLSLLINQAITTDAFPDELKVAKVSPIFKKGDLNSFNNYRPVSVLSSVSKVFEKILYDQIYNYFTEHNLFYNSQYGFRKHHSTEFATLEMIDKIINDMDNNKIPINIFLDLSKAFDTLDHKILLQKLEFYGMQNNASDLIRSYLNNRTQYVVYNGMESDKKTIKCGVPQGSILGPLFFIIYINDFIHASNIFNMVIYADDTALCTTINTYNDNLEHDINNELSGINDWLKLNKLSLNILKTKAMCFHSPQRKFKFPNITIDNHKIEYVSNFNYLGIVIDKNLNWKCHIETLSKKISKTIGIMNKLKNVIPTYALLTIYNALILSHLNYGAIAWGWQSQKLFILQKKAVRTIANSNYNAHTDPLFKKLNILKINDLCALHDLKFCYKFMNNLIPKYFYNLLENFNHRYFTRSGENLRLPAVGHGFAKHSIKYRLPLLLNTMDNSFKSKIFTHSFDGFKLYIKRTYINLYNSTCNIQNCYICGR